MLRHAGRRRASICARGTVVTEGKKSFWSGMTGALAAITALITAIGGLIAILVQVGVIGGDGTPSGGTATTPQATTTAATSAADWAVQANTICARSNDAIDVLPKPGSLEPTAALDAEEQALRINKRMLRDLSALPRPTERAVEVEEFLRLGAQVNEGAEELLAALRVGDAAAAQEHASSLSHAGKLFDESATGLGAYTCAEGASLSGVEPARG